MSDSAWPEIPYGGVISEPGNSVMHPAKCLPSPLVVKFHSQTCIQCDRCWLFCPEEAVTIAEQQVTGIDSDYCNGCGICIAECPVAGAKKPLKTIRRTSEG